MCDYNTEGAKEYKNKQSLKREVGVKEEICSGEEGWNLTPVKLDKVKRVKRGGVIVALG